MRLLSTSAGSGAAFSAGADLTGDDPVDSFGEETMDGANLITRSIVGLGKPVVAAVNGIAAGVGASICFAADLAVAKESAQFLLKFFPVKGKLLQPGFDAKRNGAFFLYRYMVRVRHLQTRTGRRAGNIMIEIASQTQAGIGKKRLSIEQSSLWTSGHAAPLRFKAAANESLLLAAGCGRVVQNRGKFIKTGCVQLLCEHIAASEKQHEQKQVLNVQWPVGFGIKCFH